MYILNNNIVVAQTQRALLYEDGKYVKTLEPGRYTVDKLNFVQRLIGKRLPEREVVLVDIRQRELTIKGQEILTSDKVAIRVSIIVQFRVVDVVKAVHEVDDYEQRLYSDVQLAARRSLASMSLEQIMTNRNQLSEDILADVKQVAEAYGVNIMRADVKDLIFPGNLQEIMNRVLAAQRLSEAAMVDARTKAQQQQLDAETRARVQQLEAETQAAVQRTQATAAAEAERIRNQAEITSLVEGAEAARAYQDNPALLKLRELETLRDLGRNARARLFLRLGQNAPTLKEASDGKAETASADGA